MRVDERGENGVTVVSYITDDAPIGLLYDARMTRLEQKKTIRYFTRNARAPPKNNGTKHKRRSEMISLPEKFRHHHGINGKDDRMNEKEDGNMKHRAHKMKTNDDEC